MKLREKIRIFKENPCCTLLQRTSSLLALVVKTLKRGMYSFRCFIA